MRQPKKTPKRKTRAELNEEGRERKRLKKQRGNKSGSRTNIGSADNHAAKNQTNKDPRIGSKIPVPLIVEPKQQVVRPAASKPNKETVQPVVTLAPEKELELLENDQRLDSLLERLDNGESLTKQEQDYVNNTLDRIDELMTILGIEFDDDDDWPNDKPDNILHLLKS